MREIEFRAWLPEDKIMRKVDNIHFSERAIETVDHHWDYMALVELMQFTGLKDSKGTKIFEGDLVKVTAEDGESYVAPVKWFGDQYYPAFDLDPKYFPDPWNYEAHALATIIALGTEKFEVVGNVWQNPELLVAHHGME